MMQNQTSLEAQRTKGNSGLEIQMQDTMRQMKSLNLLKFNSAGNKEITKVKRELTKNQENNKLSERKPREGEQSINRNSRMTGESLPNL
jgi:hypothetical protein